MSKHNQIVNAQRILLLEVNNQREWIGSQVSQEMRIPPVGLLYVATYSLRKRPQLQFEIIETSLDVPTDDAFRQKLDEFQPDLVGLRGINIFREEYIHYAELTKSWGDIPVIGGGPIATAMRTRLMQQTAAFDVLVKEEGEETFFHLLNETDLSAIPGILYHDADGNITENLDRTLISNLDALPFPDYSLIDITKYESNLSYAYNHRRQGVVLTSRGCPFKCTYCATFGGKKVRLRSADNIIAEMTILARDHDIQDFYVVDDIFNISRRRMEDFFKKVILLDNDWRFYFVNGLRADIMTRNLVDLMVEAGTVWVTYAIETASPDIQRLIKKSMNLENARDIINYTQDKEVVVNINTMYGFPTETEAEAEKTFDFLRELNHPSLLPYHFCLRGYDGCEIVEQAEAAGWDRDSFLADNILSYNALPRGTPTFSREEMMRHALTYRKEFGMKNMNHLKFAIETLRGVGYTDQDILDMYSVLQNRPIDHIDEIFGTPQLAGGG